MCGGIKLCPVHLLNRPQWGNANNTTQRTHVSKSYTFHMPQPDMIDFDMRLYLPLTHPQTRN